MRNPNSGRVEPVRPAQSRLKLTVRMATRQDVKVTRKKRQDVVRRLKRFKDKGREKREKDPMYGKRKRLKDGKVEEVKKNTCNLIWCSFKFFSTSPHGPIEEPNSYSAAPELDPCSSYALRRIHYMVSSSMSRFLSRVVLVCCLKHTKV